MSDDFLAREQAILGDTFSPSGLNGASSGGDIDFAASAFPDLDDFDGDAVAPPPVHSSASFGNGLDAGFGDFETVPSFPGVGATPVTDVKVTGDDEVDRFESEFPDIGTVRLLVYTRYYQAWIPNVYVFRSLSLRRLSRPTNPNSSPTLLNAPPSKRPLTNLKRKSQK